MKGKPDTEMHAPPSRRVCRVVVSAVVLLQLFVGIGSDLANAQSSYSTVEKGVKSSFLLQFSRVVVTWPADSFQSAEDPLVICVLGKDPLGSALDETVEGRTSKNRPIEIRRIGDVEDAAGCHLVFISRAERKRQAELLKELSGAPVLTIGEYEGFLEDGGSINMVLVEGKLKFEVNLLATDASGFKLSSRMLSLATRIISHRLVVTRDGSGSGTVTSDPDGIDCGTDCSEGFEKDVKVRLTARPAAGSVHAGWSGDADCADGRVTMNTDLSCTATFNIKTSFLSPSPALLGSTAEHQAGGTGGGNGGGGWSVRGVVGQPGGER